MIVKMNKTTILVLESHKKETLLQLRKLGVIHINPVSGESEELTTLLEKKSGLEKALRIIPLEKKKDKTTAVKTDAYTIADKSYALQDKLLNIKEDLDRLKQEQILISPWGDFNPDDIRELRDKGIDLHFCTIKESDTDKIPEELDYISLQQIKADVKILITGNPESLPFSYKELVLPQQGLRDIGTRIDKKEKEKIKLEEELGSLVPGRVTIEEEIKKIGRNIEFEQVRAGMEIDEQVTYLTGFIPVHFVDKLKKAAAENGWGILMEEPKECDNVPTLLKNPKWVSIINPIFDFFGTLPGYHEADISVWFLLFFSLFFAMIIGDAGYGVCILFFTFLARIKMKKAPPAPFILFTVMGISTVIWGAITGTWFGVKELAESPVFSWMIVDSIASFPKPGREIQIQQFFMNLCFTIAIIHLTIAHLINFVQYLPGLKTYANLGKISLLWGLYFLIQFIVFKKPLPPYAVWLVGIGFTINFIFIEQEDHFFKGILSSLKNIIPITLNSISCFSDIISYVRLFAVGLATVKVAEAFNGMAAGVGFNSIAVIGSIIILIFGHSLNMAMAGMSVLVHGLRLNMLEFSGHLDLQWAGTKYKPFS